MSNKILYPAFAKIVKICKDEIKTKYKHYGNNWVTTHNLYWQTRLKNEVEEYINSMSREIEKRKLINIINIAAMAYDTAAIRGCVIHVVPFAFIMQSEDCSLATHCEICNIAVQVSDGIITPISS